VSEETPFQVARRLHAQGVAPEEIERELRGMGLDADDVRIASRAARGEAGVASPVLRDEPAPLPSLADAPPAEAPAHPCPQHEKWPVAATCGRCGKFFCHQCLRDAGLTQFPVSKQCPDCEKTHPQAEKLVGLGGWLFFPAMQITVAPLAYGVIAALAFRSANPEAIAGAVISVLLAAYSGFTAMQFFQRRRLAVPLMLGFYVLTVLSSLISESSSAVRGLASTIIWFAYFLMSERVKNTFTR
jgi:hypothetical protein